MNTQTLKVSGMSCAGCIGGVTDALKAVSGVRAVTVSFPDREATVQYDERLTSPMEMNAALQVAGYGA